MHQEATEKLKLSAPTVQTTETAATMKPPGAAITKWRGRYAMRSFGNTALHKAMLSYSTLGSEVILKSMQGNPLATIYRKEDENVPLLQLIKKRVPGDTF